MKKILKTFLVGCLVIAACQKEQLEEPNGGRGGLETEVEFTLSMPGGLTKTSLGLKEGDSNPVYW